MTLKCDPASHVLRTFEESFEEERRFKSNGIPRGT